MKQSFMYVFMEFTKVLIAIYVAAILGAVAMLPKLSCPDSYCDGQPDGDQELPASGISGVVEKDIGASTFYDHYLTCSSRIAYCRPCPKGLYYNKPLESCVYKNVIEEYQRNLLKSLCPNTTKELKAADDDCKMQGAKGAKFSGNLVDTRNNINRKPTKLYMACWGGRFLECLPCNVPLVFYELKNWNSNEYYMYGHCGYPN